MVFIHLWEKEEPLGEKENKVYHIVFITHLINMNNPLANRPSTQLQTLNSLSKTERQYLEFENYTKQALEEILGIFSEIENIHTKSEYIEQYEIKENNKELKTYIWWELITYWEIEEKQQQIRDLRERIEEKIEDVVAKLRKHLSKDFRNSFWYLFKIDNKDKFIILDFLKPFIKPWVNKINLFSKHMIASTINWDVFNKETIWVYDQEILAIFWNQILELNISTFQNIVESFNLLKNLFLVKKYQKDYENFTYSYKTNNFVFKYDIEKEDVIELITKHPLVINNEKQEIKNDTYPSKLEEISIITLEKWTKLILGKVFWKYIIQFETITEELIIFLKEFDKIEKQKDRTRENIDFILNLENNIKDFTDEQVDILIEYDIERLKEWKTINIWKYFITIHWEFWTSQSNKLLFNEFIDNYNNTKYKKLFDNIIWDKEKVIFFDNKSKNPNILFKFLIRVFEEFIELKNYNDILDYYNLIIKKYRNINERDFIKLFKEYWKKYWKQITQINNHSQIEQKWKIEQLIDEIEQKSELLTKKLLNKTLTTQEIQEILRNKELWHSIGKRNQNTDIDNYSTKEIIRYFPFFRIDEKYEKKVISDYDITWSWFIIFWSFNYTEELINTITDIFTTWASRYDFDSLELDKLIEVSKVLDTVGFLKRRIQNNWKIKYKTNDNNINYIKWIIKLSEVLYKKDFNYIIEITNNSNNIFFDEFDLNKIDKIEISIDILERLVNNKTIQINDNILKTNIFNKEIRGLFKEELLLWEERVNKLIQTTWIQ